MHDRRFEVDEDAVRELATSIQRQDKQAALLALDRLFRDHPQASTIRHWIDLGKDAA